MGQNPPPPTSHILFHFQKDQLFGAHAFWKGIHSWPENSYAKISTLYLPPVSWALSLQQRKEHAGIPYFKRVMELKYHMEVAYLNF